MLELKISPSVGVIAQTFKRVKELRSSGTIDSETPIRIVMTQGVYQGIISYNMSNPLILEAASGVKPEDCVISAENCEAFHKDTENRAVFVIGLGATDVTLRGFTIENTHLKSADNAALGNQAEALCFHNQSGSLLCQNMRFISRQDTIHVKGFSRFEKCYITGDVDFIWGYCDTSVFENCHIHTREDNRGGVKDAYVLQSRALNSRPGFIFIDCDFTADKRPQGSHIYIARSQGTGKANSVDRWDSVALINCSLDENYDEALWTDENATKEVYPEKGCKDYGWREYSTKRIDDSGEIRDDSITGRNVHGYIMTKDEADDLRNQYSLEIK